MKIGLSLAMNSANSESKNSARKIHSDQYPRRLALKFCHRRRLIGEMEIQRRSGGTSRRSMPTAVVSGDLIPVFASISHLPRLEIDPRIDPGVGEVGDQVHDDADEREDVERGEHDRVVAVEYAFEAQHAEPVERKDRLDQQRAGKEGVHE